MTDKCKYDVFISYSRKDYEEVKSFIDTLSSKFPNLKIWWDIDDIEIGSTFDDKIIDAINNSERVFFALSDNALSSEYAKNEVLYAKNTNKKVVPILLKGASLKEWFLFYFGRVDCIDITNQIQLDKLFKDLSKWTDSERSNNESEVLSEDNHHINSELQEHIIKVGGVEFKMIKVEGGSFDMGATAEQGDDAYEWEKPVHRVTLDDYYIGETEVTQSLWEVVMGNNPSFFEGENRPVESVSWYDCQEFIKKLNDKTGLEFRLPTEAEWEYAARGGNKSKRYMYSGSNTLEDVAWFCDNTRDSRDFGTQDVKGKKPNELGLYDMSGNVNEWCSDWEGEYGRASQRNPWGPESGSSRVLRGGSWGRNARHCRVSSRRNGNPGSRGNGLGLRLVLIVR